MMGFLIVNIIAVVGFYLFFTTVLKQKEAFFPFCFISVSVLLIYIFGCAEMLSLGFVVVILLGFGLFAGSIWYLYKKKEKPGLDIFLNPTLFFMLGGIVWCYVLSRGINPSHFDDFSHWFKICKLICADNSYPCTQECNFQNYVPGTATWIYYVTNIIGYSPQNCFFAQMILNISCCAGMLAVIKNEDGWGKKLIVMFICAVFSVILCSMDATAYVLLVDGTLGLAAALAVIYIAASAKEWTGIKRTVTVITMCGFIALIKAAGSYLNIFIAVAYYHSIKSSGEKKSRIREVGISVLAVAVPYLITLAYTIRAKSVFGNETWKQGTVEEYNKIFTGWDSSRYLGIIKRFLTECFDIVHASAQIRILWIVMAIVIVLFIAKSFGGEEKYFIIGYIPLVIILWFLGMLMTFFTFGEREANSDLLVSFKRYAGSAAIFTAEILVLYLLWEILDITEKKRKCIVSGICCAVCVAACLTAGLNLRYIFGAQYYDFEIFSDDVWRFLKTYYPERWDYNDDGYAMIIDIGQRDYDNYYKLFHVLVTYFRTTNCNVYDIKDLEAAGYTIEDVREVFPNVIFYSPDWE